MRLISILLSVNSCFVIYCNAYRPVVIVHGIMTGNLSMLPLASTIESAHPGTKVYVPGRFAGWSSLLPLWHQVLSIGSDILNISFSHPEGINLIGYSQGGLIARGILEAFPDHNVKNFISLSAPHGGQYGTEFLRLFFKNLTRSTAYRLFYSRIGQQTSVGNYWRDPYHDSLYLEYSNFLPYLNNDKPSPDSIFFKRGITNLRNVFLIGGPDDGVITPWQSSQFGYYDEDLNVVELFDQHTFKKDGLGLKTLKDSGRLKLITLSGVSHFNWHFNETVINEYILPNLD